VTEFRILFSLVFSAKSADQNSVRIRAREDTEDPDELLPLSLCRSTSKCREIRILFEDSIARIASVQNVGDHAPERLMCSSWYTTERKPRRSDRQRLIGLVVFSAPRSPTPTIRSTEMTPVPFREFIYFPGNSLVRNTSNCIENQTDVIVAEVDALSRNPLFSPLVRNLN
jgi:hypothetical protein